MDCTGNKQTRLRIVYGDVTLGVHSADVHAIFSYARGGLESLVMDDREWLYRTPKPAFWRATTDNDRGSGFPFRSAVWIGADLFLRCREIKVKIDGKAIPLPAAPENNRYSAEETAKKVQIIFFYETITSPAVVTEVSYLIEAGGTIRMDVHYHGNKELPELPVFGMQFIFPTKAVSYRYEGLSGETYPDRMAGGIPGIYEVDGLPVTPYLVPQDCGVHMNTRWVEIYRDFTLNNADRKAGKIFGIRFQAAPGASENFAFSCLPYTAQELENATHQEELPPARRTVLSILGAVRGVGGIDSWGTDVEEAYRIDAGEDISFSFLIESCSCLQPK